MHTFKVLLNNMSLLLLLKRFHHWIFTFVASLFISKVQVATNFNTVLDNLGWEITDVLAENSFEKRFKVRCRKKGVEVSHIWGHKHIPKPTDK